MDVVNNQKFNVIVQLFTTLQYVELMAKHTKVNVILNVQILK